jgi:hypothetical protein
LKHIILIKEKIIIVSNIFIIYKISSYVIKEMRIKVLNLQKHQ